MKKIFTQLNFVIVLTLALLSYKNSIGQVVLEVDGIGSFEATLANFDVNDPCGLDVSDPIRLADDGTLNLWACDPFVDANIQDKIAVVRNGQDDDCRFAEKAANVAANNPTAVVICNDVPGIQPMGPTQGVTVSVPTIMVSLQDCFNLINALEGGNEFDARIRQNPVALPGTVNIVWGDQPGQGQFDGGLNGWTVENCFIDHRGNVTSPLSWQWYETPIEEFFSSQLVSYSRCDGAAGYEATLWNIDPANGVDLGDPPNYPDHHCELVSPVIDLSASGPVSLQFWQTNFSLNGNDNPGDPVSRFYISYDGGMTWPEEYYVQSGNILTDRQTVWANGELRRYALPQLAGEPNIRLKFEFHGDFYAWYIDDVYFIETPNNSLTIFENIYGIQASSRTPINLVEPVLAIAGAQNTGVADQTNVEVDVRYVSPSQTTNTTIELGLLESDSIGIECATADPYTPNEIGSYSATMTVQSDSMDFDLSDNSLDFAFSVTDSIWAKDPGEVNGFVRPADATNFVWGPVFSAPDDYQGTDMIYGFEFGFQLADSIDDNEEFLTWSILEWNDTNGDFVSQQSERNSLQSGFVQFKYRDGIDNEMTIYNLEDLERSSPIAIEAGKNYILAIQWDNPDRDLNMFGYNGYNYDWMRTAFDECASLDRYTDIIGVGNDISGDWSTGGWNGDIVPAMRLITKPIVSTRNEIAQNFSFDMYPNPVAKDLNIGLEFEEVVDNLEISILDISGKVVDVRNDVKVTSGQYVFDLSRQHSGVYFAKIRTDEGIATKRFIVKKTN